MKQCDQHCCDPQLMRNKPFEPQW